MVFLESLTAIEGALSQGRGKKLNREKIGDFVLAFDESKRVLSVIAREKVCFTRNLLGGLTNTTLACVAHIYSRQHSRFPGLW
jgi:hypothetical protein